MKSKYDEDNFINDYMGDYIDESLQKTICLCRDLPEIDLPPDFSENLHNKLAGLSIVEKRTGLLSTFKPRHIRIASAIAACIAIVLILRVTMFTDGFFNTNTQRDADMRTRAAEGNTMMSLQKQESVSDSVSAVDANIRIETADKANAYDNLKDYAAGMGYDFSDIPPGLGRAADDTDEEDAAKSIKIILPAQKYDEFSKWLLDSYGRKNAVSSDQAVQQEGSVTVIIDFIDVKQK